MADRAPQQAHVASLVAMQRTVDGNADVWVLDTERGVQRRLTFGDERDDSPAWSPDGRRVAFSSERTGASISSNGPPTGRDTRRPYCHPRSRNLRTTGPRTVATFC